MEKFGHAHLGLEKEFENFIKNQRKADEKRKMETPFSNFVGFYCVSWWDNGGLEKIFVKDEVRAVVLFEDIAKVTKDAVMLSQDDLLIKLA